MTRPVLSEEDFADLVALVKAAWPKARSWDAAEDLYPLFRHTPARPLHAAFEEYFTAGHKTAPKPSELAARAQRLAKTLPPEGVDPTTYCGHTIYGVEDLGNGYREATCAACRHTWIKPAAQLPTAGERADRHRSTPTPATDHPEDTPW